jgi:hypothetical protein
MKGTHRTTGRLAACALLLAGCAAPEAGTTDGADEDAAIESVDDADADPGEGEAGDAPGDAGCDPAACDAACVASGALAGVCREDACDCIGAADADADGDADDRDDGIEAVDDAPDAGEDAPDAREDFVDVRDDAPDAGEDAPDARADSVDARDDAPDAGEDAPDAREDFVDARDDAPDVAEESVEPVDDGEDLVEDVEEDAPPEDAGEAGGCVVSCEVTGTSAPCTAPFSVTSTTAGVVLRVDMTGHAEMQLEVEVCDPTGFLVHLADSPSCNGWSGDGGDFSNDAEVHTSGTGLYAYASDEGGSVNLLTLADYLPASGCANRTLLIGDQYLASADGSFARLDSPYLLRINPPADAEGTPDAIWYLGFGRSVGSSSRTGTGFSLAKICLR